MEMCNIIHNCANDSGEELFAKTMLESQIFDDLMGNSIRKAMRLGKDPRHQL